MCPTDEQDVSKTSYDAIEQAIDRLNDVLEIASKSVSLEQEHLLKEEVGTPLDEEEKENEGGRHVTKARLKRHTMSSVKTFHFTLRAGTTPHRHHPPFVPISTVSITNPATSALKNLSGATIKSFRHDGSDYRHREHREEDTTGDEVESGEPNAGFQPAKNESNEEGGDAIAAVEPGFEEGTLDQADETGYVILSSIPDTAHRVPDAPPVGEVLDDSLGGVLTGTSETEQEPKSFKSTLSKGDFSCLNSCSAEEKRLLSELSVSQGTGGTEEEFCGGEDCSVESVTVGNPSECKKGGDDDCSTASEVTLFKGLGESSSSIISDELFQDDGLLDDELVAPSLNVEKLAFLGNKADLRDEVVSEDDAFLQFRTPSEQEPVAFSPEAEKEYVSSAPPPPSTCEIPSKDIIVVAPPQGLSVIRKEGSSIVTDQDYSDVDISEWLYIPPSRELKRRPELVEMIKRTLRFHIEMEREHFQEMLKMKNAFQWVEYSISPSNQSVLKFDVSKGEWMCLQRSKTGKIVSVVCGLGVNFPSSHLTFAPLLIFLGMVGIMVGFLLLQSGLLMNIGLTLCCGASFAWLYHNICQRLTMEVTTSSFVINSKYHGPIECLKEVKINKQGRTVAVIDYKDKTIEEVIVPRIPKEQREYIAEVINRDLEILRGL